MSTYRIDYCGRCSKVKHISGEYYGPLVNGLTSASEWCSCPSVASDLTLGALRELVREEVHKALHPPEQEQLEPESPFLGGES